MMAFVSLRVVFFALGAHLAAGASSSSFLQIRMHTDQQPDFSTFLQKHGREYDQAQYAERLALYEKSARFVREHNSQTERRWTAVINKFSDWSSHELTTTLGERGVARAHRHEGTLVQEDVTPASATLMTTASALPESMDWSHLSAMKDVMDQGSCGSCWAVGSATLLRAHAEIAKGVDPGRYAVQQLVSCVPNEHQCGGSGGCHGGTTELALKYVMSRGIMLETEFPYHASDNTACPDGSALTQVELDAVGSSLIQSGGHSGGLAMGLLGYDLKEENKMSSLMEALQTGPAKVSIGIPDDFHSYSSGVMDGCSPNAVLTHAALVIGYGNSSGEGYWLMQNSWGPDWGDSGHFKFLRRSNSYEESDGCGTDDAPLKGNGCKMGPNKSPDSIRVCGMCGLLSAVVVPVFQK